MILELLQASCRKQSRILQKHERCIECIHIIPVFDPHFFHHCFQFGVPHCKVQQEAPKLTAAPEVIALSSGPHVINPNINRSRNPWWWRLQRWGDLEKKSGLFAKLTFWKKLFMSNNINPWPYDLDVQKTGPTRALDSGQEAHQRHLGKQQNKLQMVWNHKTRSDFLLDFLK